MRKWTQLKEKVQNLEKEIVAKDMAIHHATMMNYLDFNQSEYQSEYARNHNFGVIRKKIKIIQMKVKEIEELEEKLKYYKHKPRHRKKCDLHHCNFCNKMGYNACNNKVF